MQRPESGTSFFMMRFSSPQFIFFLVKLCRIYIYQTFQSFVPKCALYIYVYIYIFNVKQTIYRQQAD